MLEKSAEILIGIDDMFRYFLSQKNPDISEIEFEIPIRIRKGSWEALIPENIGEWLGAALGTGVATYLINYVKKLAENDAKDKGLKDVFKGIVKAVKWSIEIRKHLKSSEKEFSKAVIQDNDGIQYIGIPDKEGNLLYVPIDQVELYVQTPENLLDKIVKHIEPERELAIEFSETEKGDKDDTGKPATISHQEKFLFYQNGEENNILFPELEHGKQVELEGHVTRGNERANSIGFFYNEHVLTCYPINGTIVEYKHLMFTNCVLKGYVDRKAKNGEILEKRPRIQFLELLPIESAGAQLGLFN